jgi:hypothetical protein
LLAASPGSTSTRRRLHPDAEALLTRQIGPLSRERPLRVRILLPEHEAVNANDVQGPLRRHFAARREEIERQLADMWRWGRRSLLIGFIVLSGALACVEIVDQMLPPGAVSRSLQEGLTILGWVALWRPAELLLHDWRPLRRDAMVFAALERAEVDIGPPG